MSILKDLGKIVSMAFEDDGFIKGFKEQVAPKENFQKQIAENTKKMSEMLDDMSNEARDIAN